MSYVILCLGVYTGLYIRKYDSDQESIKSAVSSARNMRKKMVKSFKSTVWDKWDLFQLEMDSKKYSETIGGFFDEYSVKFLTDGLYKMFEEIQDHGED